MRAKLLQQTVQVAPVIRRPVLQKLHPRLRDAFENILDIAFQSFVEPVRPPQREPFFKAEPVEHAATPFSVYDVNNNNTKNDEFPYFSEYSR
ncbi:hypothetical protein [Cohnella rhizosphaerae]|uniref:hypothetical protein n=1 Tax=Cohnella rhizosphaerae TaxID=1457232 RepID=UPI0030B880AA